MTEYEAREMAKRLGLHVGCYTTDGHPELTEWVVVDEYGDDVDWEQELESQGISP